MIAGHLPLLLTGSLALLALLLFGWQLRQTRRLRKERDELCARLAAPPVVTDKGRFAASLDSAERRQPETPAAGRSSTEKYRFVAALADQGVEAKRIAEALQLAPAEVEQLLQLARLRPRQSD